MNIESNISGKQKPKGIWNSRSTQLCFATLAAFLIFSFMVAKAGQFDAGYGAAGLMFLSSIIKYALDHQHKTEPTKPTEK